MAADDDTGFILARAACEMAGLELGEAPGLGDAMASGDDDFALDFNLPGGGLLSIIYWNTEARFTIAARIRPLAPDASSVALVRAMESNWPLIQEGIGFAIDPQARLLHLTASRPATRNALPDIAHVIGRVAVLARAWADELEGHEPADEPESGITPEGANGSASMIRV